MPSLKINPLPVTALALLITISLACGVFGGADSPAETAAESGPSGAEPTAPPAPEPTATPRPTATAAPPTAAPEPTAESETASDIESSMAGAWKSGCMDAGDGTYVIITLVFDGAGLGNDRTDFYSDPGCASATGLVKTSQTTYALGGGSIISEKNAYEIDISITAWELKQEGVVIADGADEATQYDIIAVEGDTLYTSGINRDNPGPILTPDDRPATFDLVNAYTRQ